MGGDEAGFYYVMELADAVQTGTLVGQDPESSLTALPRSVEPDDYVPHSVCVLPFRTGGTNGADWDLCDRVTEAFIDALSLAPGVAVRPRKSGWVGLDEEELRRSLARTNAMRHVLTGRVTIEGETLALGLRLFENGADPPVWAETFTGSTNQLIEFERRGLAGVLARFEVAVPEETQRRIDVLLTNNLAALGFARQAASQYYARGDTQVAFTEGMRLVQRALALDPGYVEADYSDTYFLRCVAMDRAPVELWPKVRGQLDAILDGAAGGCARPAGGTSQGRGGLARAAWPPALAALPEPLLCRAGLRGAWREGTGHGPAAARHRRSVRAARHGERPMAEVRESAAEQCVGRGARDGTRGGCAPPNESTCGSRWEQGRKAPLEVAALQTRCACQTCGGREASGVRRA